MADEYCEDVDVQPSGVDLSTTFLSVNEILTNPEFEVKIKDHNGWPADMTTEHAAIMFLACRYQMAVATLSKQTSTLKREVDGANTCIRDLEDRLQDAGVFALD